MQTAIRMINDAKATQSPSTPEKVIVDLHPDRPTYRGVSTPQAIISLEADPTFDEIGKAGGVVHKHSEPHEVLDGYFMVSGRIPRTTDY
jgi:7,8-dihydropterin-6-yl-methyl-4-(beta-D-ribofuranosyl)aminobenzene 5'-phosphate synthase